MKIVITSDLHGKELPIIEPCDLLIIAGDLCPDFLGPICLPPGVTFETLVRQSYWVNGSFKEWAIGVPAKKIMAVWGNHDFIGEQRPYLVDNNHPVTFLTNHYITYEGLTIYGTPLSPIPPGGFRWAFCPSDRSLKLSHQAIPKCDILISHGPMYGVLDEAKGGHLCGSLSLASAVCAIEPKLLVTGHIHEAAGIQTYGKTLVVNNSYVDERYRIKNQPRMVELL